MPTPDLLETPPPSQPAAPTAAAWLASLGSLAALSACGGGTEADSGLPPQMLKTDSAVMDRTLLVRASSKSAPVARASMSATTLMDWAEGSYTSLFPGHKTDQSFEDYVYRYYPETGNYLGVKGGTAIYVLGPATGNVLTYVGTLNDYACTVDPSSCTLAPASAAEAARFLAQATLGATHAEISALMSTSYAGWIDSQLQAPRSQSHYDWMVAKGYADETYRNSSQGLDPSMWRKFISSTDPLRQRMTLALSEILVMSITGISPSWRQFCAGHYLDILEENAFGNYRTLLEQVSLSTAMGNYLTYRGNVKANATTGSQPDENYARELMQLFTIGLVELNMDGTVKLVNGAPVETYQQDDVSGLARVFTGWEHDTTGFASSPPPDYHLRPMRQVSSRYETGSKTFLGVTIPAGTSATTSLGIALDTVFNHPNTPPFIAKQLIQRLVTSNPSPAYVQRVATVFANNGTGTRGDLAATLRAILLDVDARDLTKTNQPGFGKLREPVVRFLNWARAFTAGSPSDAWAIGDLSDPGSRLGQSPMRSPSVFNFFRPGYVPPNSALASQGLVGPEFQITNESSVAGYVNFVQSFVAGSRIGDVRANYATLLALVDNSAALLDEINLVLAANQVSATTLATLKTALDTISVATTSGKNNRIYAALTLMMASPEYIAQK